MMIVPIFVIATAPILVEFIGLTSGAVVSILSSFAGARSNLMDLCAMGQEWKLATDLVDDLSILLSSSNSAHGPKERALHTERKAELVMKSSPEALGLCSGLSVHNVDYFTAEKDLRDALSTCSWNGLEGVSGYIPLGCLYGFVQQASDTRQQWRTAKMDVVMRLFASQHTPRAGAVLVPPHVNVMLVPRDPGLVNDATVLENILFAMPKGAMREEDEKALMKVIVKLCMQLQMTPGLFSTARLLNLSMMQVLSFGTAHDRTMLALLRVLLPMPDVLLIQDSGALAFSAASFQSNHIARGVQRCKPLSIYKLPVCLTPPHVVSAGKLDDARASALARILERFVEGHDLAGLVADEPPPLKHRALRTVIWSAPPQTIRACGITRLVGLNESNELSVAGVDDGSPTKMAFVKEAIDDSASKNHNGAPEYATSETMAPDGTRAVQTSGSGERLRRVVRRAPVLTTQRRRVAPTGTA